MRILTSVQPTVSNLPGRAGVGETVVAIHGPISSADIPSGGTSSRNKLWTEGFVDS